MRYVLAAVALFCLTTAAEAAPAKGALYGLAIALDPGHGGRDPGASGDFKLFGHGPSKSITEAAYVSDVALRVASLVKKDGGLVILTRHNASVVGPNDAPASMVLPYVWGQPDIYTTDGAEVVAHTAGMRPRMEAARRFEARYGRSHHVAFLAIHFDTVPNADIQGVHIVAPDGNVRLAEALLAEFKKHGRTRHWNGKEFMPLDRSGDKSHGLRNLYVLDAKNNPIPDRALVELGNFENPADNYKLRDPAVRQAFAEIIVAGLIAFNNQK